MGVAGGHELGQHPGADLLDRGVRAEVESGKNWGRLRGPGLSAG
jgi:hypothetical protein